MKIKWLAELRGDRTQDCIAKAAGITQQHYSLIESGKRIPSVPIAKRIAKVLGFEWTRFFEE